MSRNTEIDPEKDELTQDFAVGRQLDVLFDHCCSAFAALPTSSLMLELDFMTLKVERNASATQTAVDQKMAYNRNILHEQREARCVLVGHFTAGNRNEHNHTAEQIILGCEQMLNDSERRYSKERMAVISSRRKFARSLTAGDKEIHKRAAKRLDSKFEASGRVLLGENEWQEKERHAVQELTRHERSLESIKSITCEDRVLAVVMEDKVVGQVGATKTFWAYLKREDLEDCFRKHMPLGYGFAKKKFRTNYCSRYIKEAKEGKYARSSLFCERNT